MLEELYHMTLLSSYPTLPKNIIEYFFENCVSEESSNIRKLFLVVVPVSKDIGWWLCHWIRFPDLNENDKILKWQIVRAFLFSRCELQTLRTLGRKLSLHTFKERPWSQISCLHYGILINWLEVWVWLLIGTIGPQILRIVNLQLLRMQLESISEDSI